eukprot:4232974-Alexandrium_andersonii.AAC.1
MSAKILGNVARHCIEAGKVQGKAKWKGEDQGEWVMVVRSKRSLCVGVGVCGCVLRVGVVDEWL